MSHISLFIGDFEVCSLSHLVFCMLANTGQYFPSGGREPSWAITHISTEWAIDVSAPDGMTSSMSCLL